MRYTALSLLLTSLLTFEARAADELLPVRAHGLTAIKGFEVERVCRISRDFGSWVSIAFDPQGRIITSDQSGPLYRVTVPPIGEKNQPAKIEKLDMPLGGAHGLLYAFDSLYVVCATPKAGLYRVPDTDGRGVFGEPELLLPFNTFNEHGPHSVVLGPEKKWLYFIAGNATKVPDGLTRNRLAWIDGTGDFPQPSYQGWVGRITPDGKARELFSAGLRNSFDIAVSTEGELFTFDSDNEGYMGLPWYRPTSVFHLTSGADLGWRQGPDTMQAVHPDNAAPVVEVGPGSPTGTVFGTGAKFPAKYQRAMFVCDWSYGRIYAIHMKPAGATYTATPEVFLSGRPLPAVDIQVGRDGALYFLTGGRGVQSAIYRLTYSSPDAPRQEARAPDSELRLTRRKLEALHGSDDPNGIAIAWPYLGHSDRAIRYAARGAIEHHDEAKWAARALKETDTQAALEAMLALCRQGHCQRRSDILPAMARFQWEDLTREQKISLLRTYQILFRRMKLPVNDQRQTILAQLDKHYPNTDDMLDRELASVLFAISANDLLERTITSLSRASTAMRQIHYLMLLKQLDSKAWTDQQKKRLRSVLEVEEIRLTASRPYRDVVELLGELLKTVDATGAPVSADEQPKKLVKEWKVADLLPHATKENLKERDVDRGRVIFRGARCHTCHRIGSTGGTLGPNLTSVAGRYAARDVLEALIEPNKVIADPYRTTLFVMNDGKQIAGQIVDLGRGQYTVRTDPLQPFARVKLNESDVEETRPSNVSLMPTGLVNHLTRDEILDLMAYLLASSSISGSNSASPSSDAR
jgi:putative heme-binding domain-containing protein